MSESSVYDRELAENWEEHARADPLWAILSQTAKHGRQWDVEEFFSIGARDIDSLFEWLASHKIYPARGKALDFGCGVGRLTQALADYFDRVVGVDVSPTMIGLGRELNFNGDQVEFCLNQADDLAELGTDDFDFVLSHITLQHIRPELIRAYLAEFLRILKPGGILAFNLPSTGRPEFADGLEVEPMVSDAYRARVRVVDPPTSLAPATEAKLKVIVENDSPVDWEPDEVAKAQIDTHWVAGDGSWKCSKIAAVGVGNHWLSFDGTNLINDDGRESLPQGLRAGERSQVELVIKSPAEPGVYLCEVDLVHERITWFAQRGSPTARFPITVGEPPRKQLRSAVARVLPAVAEPLRAWRAWFEATLRERRRARLRRRHDLSGVWEGISKRLPDAEGGPVPYSMFAIPRPEVVEFLNERGGEVLVNEEGHAAGWVYESYWYFVRRASQG